MNAQPAWLAEAWRELGQSEIAGPRHNPRITAFFKELGHEAHARDEVAWCAAFAGACLERCGQASTRSLMARSYARFGEPLDEERLGAIAVLSRGNNPAFGHVGFLVGWSQDRIWLLGGNQGDAVSVAGYERSRLVSLRWPGGAEVASPVEVEPAPPDIFATALDHVLEMEGGYTDDPHDPGGPTNRGITLTTLAAWRKREVSTSNRAALIADLKAIAPNEVAAIYAARYWQPAGCPEMAAPLAFFHFDTAVNHGVTGAARLFQAALGADVDGEIGPQTRNRIDTMPILEVLAAYAAIRRKKYRALPHFWRFGRGWLRRVDRTLERATGMADATRKPTESNSQTTNQNGDRDMSTTEHGASKWWGQSMTIWGALITAAAAVLPTVGPIIGLDVNAALVRELGDQILSASQALIALAGTALTIYGRARAVLPLARRSINLKL
ncbi:MAG: TIGR02594 family protein [Alphaproteobacteria bacterium]|nr:TIGR02594 family protein [Alphaproteobacteria bacterium]